MKSRAYDGPDTDKIDINRNACRISFFISIPPLNGGIIPYLLPDNQQRI
jgi:hypothetical protein